MKNETKNNLVKSIPFYQIKLLLTHYLIDRTYLCTHAAFWLAFVAELVLFVYQIYYYKSYKSSLVQLYNKNVIFNKDSL